MVQASSLNAAQERTSGWEGPLVGGLLGTFMGSPLLGILGGFAYKLFKTDGMAEGARKLVGDITGSDDPVGSLGRFLGGDQAKPVTDENAAQAQPKSGIPGWLKALGIGVAGVTALNFVQDNVVNTFMGVPRWGGFGFGMGMGMGMPGFMPGGFMPGAGFLGYGYPFF